MQKVVNLFVQQQRYGISYVVVGVDYMLSLSLCAYCARGCGLCEPQYRRLSRFPLVLACIKIKVTIKMSFAQVTFMGKSYKRRQRVYGMCRHFQCVVVDAISGSIGPLFSCVLDCFCCIDRRLVSWLN